MVYCLYICTETLQIPKKEQTMSFFRRSDDDWSPFKAQEPQEEPIERQVWQFMIDYQEEHHMPPTLEEIAETLPSQYRSSAKHYAEKLVEAGWVEEVAEEGKSRRYRATNAPTKLTDNQDEIFTRIIPQVNQ